MGEIGEEQELYTLQKKISSLASYAVAMQENQEFFSCTDISAEKFSSLISVQENAMLDFFAAVCIIPIHRLEKFTPAKYQCTL